MGASLTVSSGKTIIAQQPQGAFAPTSGNGVAPASGSGIADKIEGTSGSGRFLAPGGTSGPKLRGPASGSGLNLRKNC